MVLALMIATSALLIIISVSAHSIIDMSIQNAEWLG